jgi:hypothetical protein
MLKSLLGISENRLSLEIVLYILDIVAELGQHN